MLLFLISIAHLTNALVRVTRTTGSPMGEAGRQAGRRVPVKQCWWAGVVREGGCPGVARVVVLR